MDILIVKLGALGDVINTLPLASALKRQLNARICWLVEPLSVPIVSGHPSVDRVIRFERHQWPSAIGPLVRQLRRQRFDVCLDLQRTLKSAAFCMAAPSKRRIGFDCRRCKEMSWLYPFERIAPADPNAHMLAQYLEFAQHLGIRDPGVRWDITVPPNAPPGLPAAYIVLNIGASKPANRWTPEGFAAVADSVRRRHDLPCVLTGAREDTALARRILAVSAKGVTDLTGKTSIPDLTAVLAGSRAVVTGDTGPMHLAVAMGKPVVALFGPSDPRRTGPFRGRVVRRNTACSPCNRRRCPQPKCMTDIRPADVMPLIAEILGRSAPHDAPGTARPARV